MLRKVLLILSGNAAASLLLFARNLLVARLIAVEDYGIAATFAVAMAAVEMASSMGLQQFIVQARDGDDPRFQAALQGFHLLRGVFSALVLFLAAGMLAELLHIPQIAWAYQVLAVVPILNALHHFDIHRLNREMRFGPLILTGAVPALLSLIAIWPLTVWFGDYRVMLFALILQAAVATATSHLVAERSYRLSLDRAVIGRALSFGWPLLINGLLLFAVFQGDKVIVGRELGMALLAIFAMGMTLTLTPTLVMGKTIQNYFLPQLSALAGDRDTAPAPFETLAQAALQATFLTGTVMVVAILYLGPWLIWLVLGEKYAGLVPLVALFAVQQGLRVFKTGPNLVALSCGNAVNAMVSNAVRVASLPAAWWVVVQGGGIPEILLVGIAAEFLGFAVSLRQLRVRQGVHLGRSLGSMVLSMLLLLVVGLSGWTLPAAIDTAALWAIPVIFGLSLTVMPELRQHLFARSQA